MASFFNHGTVIEGAYKGNYVFGLYENQLHLFDTSSVNSWKYNSGQVKPNAVIDRNTVKSVELLQEREKGVDAADVGGAALLLGPIMGAAMYADGKKKLFYVNVQYNNGSQSLLKLESELYDIVQRISFGLPKETSAVREENKKEVVNETEKGTHQTNQIVPPTTTNININPNNIEPTITRIELFLEDKEWDKARTYAEAGLDYFPTDYRLYLFLLFADLRVSDYKELAGCSATVADNKNYKKVMRFANDEVKEKLEQYIAHASENEQIEPKNNTTLQSMDNTNEIIGPEDPDYEYYEHEGFSFYFPKCLVRETAIYGRSLHFGNMETYIVPSETDVVGKNVSDGTIIEEETIELDAGILHLLCWEHKTATWGYVEAYYRAPEDEEGLYACTRYKTDTLFRPYALLRKGYSNIKVNKELMAKKREEERQKKLIAQQEYEKQMQTFMLGEYKKVAPLFSPWTAKTDRITQKGKDIFYKDLKAFEIMQRIEGTRTGSIVYATKAGSSKQLFFLSEDWERAYALYKYINKIIEESKE